MDRERFRIETGPQAPTYPLEFLQLYERYFGRVIHLTDCTQISPGLNQNQFEASQLIAEQIEWARKECIGLSVGVFGPMASGKTTVACLLASTLCEAGAEFAVYKHGLDIGRTGERLVSHTGDFSVEAKPYQSLVDIDRGPQTLITDEFQFAADSYQDIGRFLFERKKQGSITVFSLLDFDFRRFAWQTAAHLLPRLDQIVVLAARCTDCGKAATFTQRDINGQPAKVSDPAVVVGAEELYLAKCGRCHQVEGLDRSVYAQLIIEVP